MAKLLKNTAFFLALLAAGLFAAYAVSAWTEPAVSPPGGNVDTPLNTGSALQTKVGPLAAAMLYDADDTDYWVDPGNSLLSALFAGSVGIGTTTPNAALQVNGAISRQGTAMLGTSDEIATQINLGVNSTTTGKYSVVSGGLENKAAANYSTVSGGWQNTAGGKWGVVVGGHNNTAGEHSFVGAGRNNSVGDFASFSGAGFYNNVSGTSSAIVAGNSNSASGDSSFIGAGSNNIASGDYSVVSGGAWNVAGGSHSWAGGKYMQLDSNANHTFVWGYAPGTTTISTPDAFIIYSGNAGIGTIEPKTKLEVNGVIKTTPAGSAPVCDADSEGGIYYNSSDKNFYGCRYDSGASAYVWAQLNN